MSLVQRCTAAQADILAVGANKILLAGKAWTQWSGDDDPIPLVEQALRRCRLPDLLHDPHDPSGGQSVLVLTPQPVTHAPTLLESGYVRSP